MADVRMTRRIAVDVEPSRETEPKNEFVADDDDDDEDEMTSGILAKRRAMRSGSVWLVMSLYCELESMEFF